MERYFLCPHCGQKCESLVYIEEVTREADCFIDEIENDMWKINYDKSRGKGSDYTIKEYKDSEYFCPSCGETIAKSEYEVYKLVKE